MTASGQRISAENVAAPNPTPGQAPATKHLPTGWGSFRSESRRASEPSHWYATAPWNSFALREEHPQVFQDREDLQDLISTVDANSWEQLVSRVNAQVALYASFLAEVGE
jgi:hypothetical protein